MSCQTCYNDNLFLPFRQELRAQQSSFTTQVPSHDSDYYLFFEDLEVVPSYFNEAANDLDLDPDEELKSLISYDISYKVEYVVPKIRSQHILFPAFKWGDVDLPQFLKQFNQFWHDNKPSHMHWGGCFIDWVIIDEHGKAPSKINDYVEARLSEFYGDHQNTGHFGALPESVVHLQSANNYDLPTDYMAWNNLRLRIFLAPFLKLTFKQKTILEVLGFKDQYVNDVIENSTSRYSYQVAANRPLIGFNTKLNDCFLEPINFSTPPGILLLSNEMLKRPDQVAWEVNKALRRLAPNTNFDLSLTYQKDRHKWKFNWPANARIIVTVDLNRTVAQALGYLNNIINRDTFSKTAKSGAASSEYLDRARTLTVDTGPIICTQSDVASCNLAGISERFVAELKSTDFGRMSMNRNLACKPHLILSGRNRGTIRDTCTLYFRLYNLDSAGQLSPLSWPCKSYVQGMMLGRKCHCKRAQ